MSDIAVSPMPVELSGRVGEAAVVTVRVSNVGTASLEFTDLTWEAPAPGFTVSNISAILVPAGGAAVFDISWEPEEGPDSGVLMIASNDPDTPVFELPVTAVVAPEGLEVTPENLSFGSVPVGCASTQVVTLANRGLVDVTVRELTHTSGTGELTFDPDEATNGPLPFVIPPWESRQVHVTYQPEDDTADVGYLEVVSDDPFEPTRMLSQAGNGAYGEWSVDTYTRPDPMPVDVLFVLDDSASSADEQARLLAAFPTFLAALDGQNYAIGVIGFEDQGYRGELILPETEDPSAELADQLPGNGAYGYRLGLGTLARSVTTGDSVDAQRDEAQFTVIFVSDAPDESPEPWTEVWEALDTFGPHPEDAVFHAISGDTMVGCGEAWPENPAYELTVASGGSYLGACMEDWTAYMTLLGAAAIPDPARFPLSGIPLVQSLEVSVDGLATTEAWTYDAASNTVVFEEDARPAGGAVVELRYAPMPECE